MQWFNNTHDEMVLYERYGDDYEAVVAAMTTEERRRLKREVDGSEAKTVIELLGRELVEAEGDLHRVRSVEVQSDLSLISSLLEICLQRLLTNPPDLSICNSSEWINLTFKLSRNILGDICNCGVYGPFSSVFKLC